MCLIDMTMFFEKYQLLLKNVYSSYSMLTMVERERKIYLGFIQDEDKDN